MFPIEISAAKGPSDLTRNRWPPLNAAFIKTQKQTQTSQIYASKKPARIYIISMHLFVQTNIYIYVYN